MDFASEVESCKDQNLSDECRVNRPINVLRLATSFLENLKSTISRFDSRNRSSQQPDSNACKSIDSRSYQTSRPTRPFEIDAVRRLRQRLKPQPHLEFDEYQQKFPPQCFEAPERTWYNVPVRHESHYWSFSELWPPEIIFDLRRQVPLFLGMVLMVALPLGLVQGYAYPATQTVGNRPGYDCMHSGEFNFRGTDVNFGHMTFAQAKALDLAWNMVVGRGLQILLLFISCRAFYSVLLFMTERNPISYDLFMKISLTPAALETIWPLLKGAVCSYDLKSRLMLVWMLGTSVYVAISPTFIDAMSGYRAIQATMNDIEISEAQLQLPDGSQLDVSSGFTSQAYQYLERSNPPPYLDNTNIDGNSQWEIQNASFLLMSNATTISFTGRYSVQNITDGYSACCINSTTSALFLSTDHYSSYFKDNQLDMYDDYSCENWYPLAPRIDSAYSIWNQTYLRDPTNYACASKDIYTWGFSYELLLIYSCINGAWLLCTWAVFMYSSLQSQMCQKQRGFGPWRAIVDLAGAMSEMLDKSEACAYSEDDLKTSTKNRNLVMYRGNGGDCGTKRRAFGLREVKAGEESASLGLEWGVEYG